MVCKFVAVIAAPFISPLAFALPFAPLRGLCPREPAVPEEVDEVSRPTICDPCICKFDTIHGQTFLVPDPAMPS